MMGSLLGRCRYEVAMRMMGSVHCSRSLVYREVTKEELPGVSS